jgi:hypothetical protein
MQFRKCLLRLAANVFQQFSNYDTKRRDILVLGSSRLSPTILREGNNRYFFFSREEPRMHVHISSPKGEAKFWLEPTVALANYAGFNKKDLNKLQKNVEENADEFKRSWKKYFGN